MRTIFKEHLIVGVHKVAYVYKNVLNHFVIYSDKHVIHFSTQFSHSFCVFSESSEK